MSKLKGTALISGASAGIGAVYADRLAEHIQDAAAILAFAALPRKPFGTSIDEGACYDHKIDA